MNTLERSVQCENDKSFSNCTPNKMDYRQKMVVAPQQKLKNEDDDEDDLEALRLAALQSLRTKDAAHSRKQPSTQLQKIVPQFTQTSRPSYKSQRLPRRGYFHNRLQQRQNGNFYYQSPRNPNLIAIIPVDEHAVLQQMQLPCPTKAEKTESSIEPQSVEVSKFNRFKDNGSCSEEEDAKDNSKTGIVITKAESSERECVTKGVERTSETEDNKESMTDSPQKNEDDQDAEEANDDDDDILLMADLEEEDSLERLMDEMEREMNVDKPIEKREKRCSKRESKDESGKVEATQQQKNATPSAQEQRLPRADDVGKKDMTESTMLTIPSATFSRNERRSVSPHSISRVSQKRRSLSPKLRPRKKSPRRSPRRSPPLRQVKKSQREITRYRSPRMSPPRYSPRQRSPLPSRLSPRPRSPLRLSPPPPLRRSPLRGRSPRHSPPLSRISSRSKSPRPPRSRSPRPPRSRSPRFSPISRLTPRRSRSPRSRTPIRGSPSRRSRSPMGQLSPRTNRSKSPPSRRSPLRRSPPRRGTQSIGSPPRRSPSRRSPWSSPRNSPRLSPRRRRSPARWSPKEVSRKHGPPRHRSNSPDVSVHRDSSPLSVKNTRSLSRQENVEEKTASITTTMSSTTATVSSTALPASGGNLNSNESNDVTPSSVAGTDPVLEARRRKFESTKPIDPINANKKIKLNKKEEQPVKKTAGVEAQTEVLLGGARRAAGTAVVGKTDEAYVVEDTDLTMDASSYEYDEDELEEVSDDVSSVPPTGSVNTACVETIEVSSVLKPAEKDRSSKKKKKRDKEIYQVGKLKSELPLSERIGKDKKCKKRKDVIITADNSREDVEAIFEDINVEEEGDLRTELSRRRAERLNRTVPIQSARLVQSAFKGVVNEVVKNNAKVNQRHVIKSDDKSIQKDVRRVTVLHRTVTDLHDSEEETPLDSKVPVRFRLGLNKQAQDNREPKATRKTSKRQGRKVKHKSNLSVTDPEQIL